MDLLTLLIIALVVSKVLLLTVIYFLWRTNTRLKEANHMLFLLKRRGFINEQQLESLKNTDSK
jgi:hypothetical protein